MASWRDAPLLEQSGQTSTMQSPMEMQSQPHSTWTEAQPIQPMGIAERFGYGVGNVAYGLAQMAARALPQEARDVTARPLPKLEQEIRQRHIEYEARKPEGFDVAKMAGEIAGTLPMAIVASRAGFAGSLAAGALAGVAQPVVGDENKYWQTKMQQAGIGAAGGGLATGVGKILGKMVAGAENPAAKELMQEGVTPTIGQAIGPGTAKVEEKLTSLPFLGSQIARSRQAGIESLNVATYNRALAPIGQKASGAVGHEGVEEVRQTLSGAFNDLAPKLSVVPDTLETDITPVVEKAADYLPKEKMDRFVELLTRARTKPFLEAQQYLDEFATRYSRDPNSDTQALGESLNEVLTAARNSLAKQNPEYASRLSAINQGWANYDVIRRAASSTSAQEGIFTPEGLNAAVKAHAIARGGQTLGTGQFAGGQALMQDLSSPARTVLGRQVPNSGTAERLFTGTALAGMGYSAGLFRPDVLAAAGATSLPYINPMFRRIAAGAILSRPPGAEAAGQAVEFAGRIAAPGVGFALSVAGAP